MEDHIDDEYLEKWMSLNKNCTDLVTGHCRRDEDRTDVCNLSPHMENP